MGGVGVSLLFLKSNDHRRERMIAGALSGNGLDPDEPFKTMTWGTEI